MRNLQTTLTNNNFPNLETKSVISYLEESIIAGQIKGTENLTLFDVKGAILSNCPKLSQVYNDLLQCAIRSIDWEFIKNYLESKPLLEVQNIPINNSDTTTSPSG